MLDKHDHLFGRDESLEALPWLTGIVGYHLRVGFIPENTTGDGEQVFHETSLAGKLDLDRSIAKTIDSASLDVLDVSLGRLRSFIEILKLDIGIHGFAGGPLHDDVDRLFSVVKDLGIATEKRDDFSALSSKGYLNHCQQL